jgi:hypothetical protein
MERDAKGLSNPTKLSNILTYPYDIFKKRRTGRYFILVYFFQNAES